jgi:hypothetical protein
MDDLIEDDAISHISGKQARLMVLLEKETSQPCSLGKLEELCLKYHLEWSWVEKQLQKLSNTGQVIFARPWQVQFVGQLESKVDEIQSTVDVSSEILMVLEDKGSMKIIDLLKLFEARGISEESVELSLEALMKTGVIFEPSQGKVKVV